MTVLIVGAGPTGLTLACDLARRGVPCRVIDQAPVRVITTGIKGPGNKTIVLTGLAEDNNSSFATRALLNSSTDDPEDGDGMQSSSSGKNRLRGLFRKVSRVLEKSSSRDEDDKRHVLIGGFQFALK